MSLWVVLVGTLGGAALLAALVLRLGRRQQQLDRRLLSTLMHDLRTPLTSLQLTLGELSHHEGYSAEEQETLGRAIFEVVGVRSFVENLRLVDAQAGSSLERTELTAVALHEQVDRLTFRYAVMARARRVGLAISSKETLVSADPRLVELLLANLVELALSSATGEVSVSLTQPVEGTFELTCRTTGPELPVMLSVEAFAAQRGSQDRSASTRTLAVVAAGLVCRQLGWSLQRPTPDTFRVTGACL